MQDLVGDNIEVASADVANRAERGSAGSPAETGQSRSFGQEALAFLRDACREIDTLPGFNIGQSRDLLKETVTMPLYDYQCKHCKTVFEVRATFKEKELGLGPQCPQCHSKRTRQLLSSGLFLRQSHDGQSLGSPSCGPNCGRGSCRNCGN